MPRVDLGRVKGDAATINGVNAITINASEGVNLNQQGGSITISAPDLIQHLSASNPHGITKASIGLSNVENKSSAEIRREITSEDIQTALGGATITADESLNADSVNPIQNKAVDAAIKKLTADIEAKQSKIVGTAGQVLMFGNNGELVAGEAPNTAEGFLIQSISVTNPPTKTSYISGDTFNNAGMIISALYKNGATIPMVGYVVTPEVLKIANTNVTIRVTDGKISKEVTQNITVAKRNITIPTVTSTDLQQDGSSKTVTFANYNETYMTKSGTETATNQGSYEVTFTLKDTVETQWSDGTTAPKVLRWEIKPPYELYAFELNLDESNPANMITYLDRNASYRPAKMNYSTNRFEYGDWEQAWFIRDLKPVMLGFDGYIKYELDKYNYKQKATGGSSDVTNVSYPGNVMVGIPTVWIKVDNTNARRPKFYFSNKQIDGSYKAYAHTNNSGVVKDYIYMSAYDCWYDNNRIRSISGQFPTGYQTMDQQRQYCKANGDNWDMGTFSDRMLITLLLMLIGKSTDSQTVFGQGNTLSSSRSGSDYDSNKVIKSGTLDDKGLFYGYNDETYAVKVFGIENFWGNVLKRTLGLIMDNGVFKYKLIKGTHDGSATSDYSTTSATGYITSHNIGHSSNFYINDMKAGPFGLLPVYNSRSASRSIYFCDYCYNTSPNSSTILPASFGGNSGNGSHCGAFSCVLHWSASYSGWNGGVSLSFKPA